MKSSAWSVGQVAERFGVATHVLRHWESMGLLAPDRDSAGRRRYHRDDLVRVAAIRANKQAGMSLEQIATLLDSESAGRHQVLVDHLDDIAARIAALEASREMTQHALECRAHDLTTCPHFRARVEGTISGELPWEMHTNHPVPGTAG